MAVLRRSAAAAEAAVIAETSLLDGGTMLIYTGTMPTNVATAVGAQVLLATLTFGTPAFAAGASDGVVTANAITGDSSADATGTAAWARLKSSTAVAHYDVDVTATGGGGTLTFATVAFVITQAVTMTSLTFTAPLA